MKKIFLLSLLSVFFLSAFSQVIDGDAELITKINITRCSEELGELSPGEESLGGELGIWFFFWKNVSTIYNPDGSVTVDCSGWGFKLCTPRMRGGHSSTIRGVSVEVLDRTCEDVITESDNRISQGEYKGSFTKKIAYSDPMNGGKLSFLIYQMNWEYDPKNPRNGTAEIFVFKTNNLGIK